MNVCVVYVYKTPPTAGTTDKVNSRVAFWSVALAIAFITKAIFADAVTVPESMMPVEYVAAAVIARVPVPVDETDAKMPSEGLHAMLCHSLSAGLKPRLHATPSRLVRTRFPVPDDATAANVPSSGLHDSAVHEISAAEGVVRDTHVIPLLDVITRFDEPVCAIAAKIPNSGAQTIDRHSFEGDTRTVHVTPSVDVITLPATAGLAGVYEMPARPVSVVEMFVAAVAIAGVVATAAHIPNSGLHATLRHATSAADVRIVHVVPFVDVITRFPVPLDATAAKRPRDGAYAIERHSLSAGVVRLVQLIPSLDVAARFPVPDVATATKMLSPDAQTILDHAGAGAVYVVHVIPFDDTRLLVDPELGRTTKIFKVGDHAIHDQLSPTVVRAVQAPVYPPEFRIPMPDPVRPVPICAYVTAAVPCVARIDLDIGAPISNRAFETTIVEPMPLPWTVQ